MHQTSELPKNMKQILRVKGETDSSVIIVGEVNTYEQVPVHCLACSRYQKCLLLVCWLVGWLAGLGGGKLEYFPQKRQYREWSRRIEKGVSTVSGAWVHSQVYSSWIPMNQWRSELHHLTGLSGGWQETVVQSHRGQWGPSGNRYISSILFAFPKGVGTDGKILILPISLSC